MFAVVNRFDRSYEEAASDLGRALGSGSVIDFADPLAWHHRCRLGAFTLSYDEYARTTLAIVAATPCRSDLRADFERDLTALFAIGTVTTPSPLRYRHNLARHLPPSAAPQWAHRHAGMTRASAERPAA